MKRSKRALASAENLVNEDIDTTANRTFVACENAAYVLLKTRFGSTSVNRQRILNKLRKINPEAKKAYDLSYDLRVQADYGREPTLLELNRENMLTVLKKVKKFVKEVEKAV